MEQGLLLYAFTELISQLPGLHWWQSQDGQRYAFAPACHKLVEAADKLSPPKWQEFLHPHDRPRREAALQLEEGQEKTLEYRLITKTGAYNWIQESVKLVHTADSGAVLMSTATTCKEPAYRSIFNNTSLFLVLLDPEGKIQEINEVGEQFLGQAWEQVYGKPIWDNPCFSGSTHNSMPIKEAVMRAAKGEQINLQEWILNYKNTRYYGDFTLKPVLDYQGRVEYLIVEGADISQKRRLDQQWRRLAESIPDVIIRYDRKFNYLFVNPAIEAFTGHTPEYFVGKSASDIKFSVPSWQGFEESLKKVLQSRQMQTYTAWVKSPDKKERRIYSLLIPEPDDKGEVASILVITRDITELAEQESALEQTNAKLRAIIEGTSDIVFAFDKDYRLIAFNGAYQKELAQTFGVEPKLGLTLYDLLGNYPTELKNALDLLRRALQGEEFTILQEFGDPQKERNYYEINFSVIRGENGRIIGASSRTRNVSRETEIEKELKDAREFLILAENLPQIIFTARPDGQIDYLNQAFFQYTKQPKKAAEQADWQRALHPEDYAFSLEQWQLAVKSKAPGLQLEFRLRNRHGLYRWHIARAVPILNTLNQPVKWVGVISDIHEAKIASERERLAAEEFQTIAESLPHIVWTTRADGRVSYFNHKWYDYTGEGPANLNGLDWSSFIHPEDQARSQKAWQKAIINISYYQVEYRLRHKSGRYRWFMVRGVPVTDARGNVAKWFGTCTDIHENKLQRKRLQTQNDRLHQINQYLDNFVHAAAHDLRSPVANMKGLLQLLRGYSSSKNSKVVESMEISLYRLDNTLQAMIHSIELQSLKQSPAKALQLQEVFKQVHQEYKERLQHVPHEINADFGNCPTLVFIPFYLESLFRNLLSNAIKYRKENEKLIINISCRSYRQYKLLEFSDNGIGIDLEKHGNKLFRPFQRFTQQAGGKGIGLHLINNIVTKTGGKIEVKSKPGEGTSFLLYLKDLEV